MQNIAQSNSTVLSDNTVEKSTISVISEQEIFGKPFKVYGTFENPLILAKDVAEWIEYSKRSDGSYQVGQMLKTVDDDEKLSLKILTAGQNREMWFLTENGVYEVLMQSTKPIAKDFKKQVKAILHELRTKGKVEIQQSAHKSDRELDILERQIATERAKLWRELGLDAETQSKTYKQICNAYASKELAGDFVLPLPAARKTYSAEDIGKELGISAVKVGRIANHYGLKTEEYGCWNKDKAKYDSSKEVDSFRYYENAISVIAEHKDEVIQREKKLSKQESTSDLFAE